MNIYVAYESKPFLSIRVKNFKLTDEAICTFNRNREGVKGHRKRSKNMTQFHFNPMVQ